MNRHYDLYEDVLKNPSKYPKLYDLVVISAINSGQKSCYEHQLSMKLSRRRLPSTIPFRVINDPDEHKLGSGGSTIHILSCLQSDSSLSSLSSLRVLIIHAGGYSQRSPSCSVLGKLFSPVACAHSAIEDMLDITLANYLPFVLNKHMSPGVFMACSDEFESYEFDQQFCYGDVFGTNGNEIVLMAHKSSLQVAKDHGVYVLENAPETQQQTQHHDFSRVLFGCQMVLQKPSIEKMKNLAIVLKDENTENEYVYTDSVFYFSHRVTQDLLKFHAEQFSFVLAHDIEIDAYRDFLQPLGSKPQSLEEYLAPQPAKSHQILTSLYNMFRGRAILVLALDDSNFFHLGTVNELLDLYLDANSTISRKFRETLGFTKSKSSTIDPKAQLGNCCIINSRLGQNTAVDDGSIVEFCFVGESTRLGVGRNCYLSNCQIEGDNEDLKVPDNICFHTVPIKSADSLEYVTLFFDRRDDLKKVYANLRQLRFLGREVNEKLADLVVANKHRSNCVWDLRIFRAYESMSESFRRSLEFVENYFNGRNLENENSQQGKYFSLFDLLEFRSYDAMISFRMNKSLY